MLIDRRFQKRAKNGFIITNPRLQFYFQDQDKFATSCWFIGFSNNKEKFESIKFGVPAGVTLQMHCKQILYRIEKKASELGITNIICHPNILGLFEMSELYMPAFLMKNPRNLDKTINNRFAGMFREFSIYENPLMRDFHIFLAGPDYFRSQHGFMFEIKGFSLDL
jgi:hypothetical protein